MYPIRATEPLSRAIHATSELLGKLRIEFIFLSGVARAAWLGEVADCGDLDLLALMQPQQKNQVAMMAGNRGFTVDRAEVEQSEELDLVPFSFGEGADRVRIHVLLASNALYGRMVAAARETVFEERAVRVPIAEDFALLLSVAGDDEAVRALAADPAFDRRLYNEKLVAIGLKALAIEERREGVQ